MTMAWNNLVATMTVLALASACDTKSVGDLEDGGGDASESAGSSGDDDGSASQSSTAPTGDDGPSDPSDTESSGSDDRGTDPSTDPSADDGSSESGGECPPAGGPSMCDPAPMLGPDATRWSIDDGIGFETSLTDIACTVADFADDGTTMTIELHCDEEELAAHIIVLPHNPITQFNLVVDSAVRLTYVAQTPFWTNYWFALRQLDGRIIIAAGDGSDLLPSADFFAPLELELQPEVCPQECIVDECGPTERQAVDVTLDGETTRIYDANEAVVGSATGYTVQIGQATAYLDASGCDDIPPSWYRTIVYDSSEG